jgi:hypothetical protein
MGNHLNVWVNESVTNLNQVMFPGHKNRPITWLDGADEDGNKTHPNGAKLIVVEVPDESGKSKQKVLSEQSQEYEKKSEVISALPLQLGVNSPQWEPWDDAYKSFTQWGFKNDGSFPPGNATSGVDMKIKNAWNCDAAGNIVGLGRTTAEGLGNYGLANKVYLAIIDHGIDSGHGSLGVNFASGSSTDCTGSGTTLPQPGGTSHGTALAGICCAKKSNSSTDPDAVSFPVVGVAPLCKFMTLKVNTSMYNVAEIECAINYVRNKANANGDQDGKRFLLLIAHEFAYSLTIDNALEDAMNSNVLVVCAGGNTGNATLKYPASCNTASAPNRLISVGAMRANNTLLPISSTVCNIYAPGDRIVSTLNGNTFGEGYVGTSVAAAFIAGAAAVLWSRNYEIQDEIGAPSFTRNATSIKGLIMDPTHHSITSSGHRYLNLGAAVQHMNTTDGP